MLKESPLDLKKDIAILEEAIDDCYDGSVTQLILADRLRLMKQGTGFTRGFSHVNQWEIDEWYKSNDTVSGGALND